MNKCVHAQVKTHETKRSVRPVVQFCNSQSATQKRSQCVTLCLMYCTFFFFKFYCTDSMYSVYKDKLQNCYCNQFE